ncbi:MULTISPECIES: GH25 family lysozyme [Heyndrickxia]|jgi:lysozyme|uniref:GH25 family lysozyme n=1 Tax=Heyndrickxia TaxID=2837504 RepID=UPI0007792B89|nr:MULTISPECIES: GH25 family lysozyme [Heyndrickxia]MED4867850.1 GH25 family lysozyme [Weizmannia sp. CD-2023]MED4891888.1 GH25 family lysozyme [Weizmannia sp. CD-2023]NMH84264.1 glycosidase [Heyndrickxia coagulans]
MVKFGFKCVISFVMAFAFVFPTFSNGLFIKAHASSITVKHATRSVNLVSKASSAGKKVGTLPGNAPVFVTGSSGSYYRVQFQNKTAYAYKKYVANGRPKAWYTGYAADTVYLHDIRTGKTLKNTLYLATPVTVYAKQGHWLTIGYADGYYGYAQTYDTHIVRYAKRGIDLSYLQPSGTNGIDFKKVKAAGFSYAIIKASEGTDLPKTGTKDYFVQDVKAAAKAGLKVHAYHMFDATSITAAKQEADHFAQRLSAVKQQLGYVFVDVEYENLSKNKDTLTRYVDAFITELKSKGFQHTGIYTYYDFYKNRLNASKLPKGNLLWIARYNTTLGMQADVWQHRKTNCTIRGVKGNFDFDLTYNKAIGG